MPFNCSPKRNCIRPCYLPQPAVRLMRRCEGHGTGRCHWQFIYAGEAQTGCQQLVLCFRQTAIGASFYHPTHPNLHPPPPPPLGHPGDGRASGRQSEMVAVKGGGEWFFLHPPPPPLSLLLQPMVFCWLTQHSKLMKSCIDLWSASWLFTLKLVFQKYQANYRQYSQLPPI